MSCPSNAVCGVGLSDVQTPPRGSGDATDFKAGKVLFGYENNVTRSSAPDKAPVFKSHADYVRWKKASALLYSTKYKSGL